MSSRLKNKKILLYASIFLLVVVTFNVVTSETASAQAGAAAGAGLLNKALDIGAGAAWVYATVWAIYEILLALLALSGAWMDITFDWNISLVPTNMPFVIQVWSYVRDISNAVLILFILWIALTIIFSLESIGGKKQLVRIIVVALLINFSLAFTAAIFGLANQIALPFRRAVNAAGVSEVIVQNAQIHQVVNRLSTEGVELVKQLSDEALKILDEKLLGATTAKTSVGSSVASYIGAVEDTEAAILATDPAKFGPAGLNKGGATTEEQINAEKSFIDRAVQWTISLFGSPISTVGGLILSPIIDMAIASIFLALVVFAFLTVFIILAARIVAMSFLAILAPLAFIAAAVPSAEVQKYWTSWLQQVVRWAFFAPAFYFLFYTSLLVLSLMHSEEWAKASGFTATWIPLINLSIFLIFLWGSIIVGRKMGITVADGFINWGQKWMKAGLWYPPTVLGRTGLGMLRRVGARASQLERWAPRTPLMPAPIRKAFQRFGAYERDATDEARKKLKPLSSAELQRRSSMPLTTSTERGAILLELTERGDVERESGVEESQWGTPQIQQGVRELRGKGKNIIEILRARPDIATPEFMPETKTREKAIQRVVAGMKPSHIAKMERQAIITAPEDSPEVKETKQTVRRAFWHNPNFSTEHLGTMLRTDARMSNEMVRELQEILDNPPPEFDPDTIKRIEERFRPYVTGVLVQGSFPIPRQWRGDGSTTGGPTAPAGPTPTPAPATSPPAAAPTTSPPGGSGTITELGKAAQTPEGAAEFVGATTRKVMPPMPKEPEEKEEAGSGRKPTTFAKPPPDKEPEEKEEARGGREPTTFAKPPPDIVTGKPLTEAGVEEILKLSEREIERKREVLQRFKNNVSLMEIALREGKAPDPAYTRGKIKEAQDVIARVEKELRDAGYQP